MRFACALMAAVVAAALTGCGGSGVEPVNGTLVYTDGSPVPAGATVIFEAPAKQFSASGTTEEGGAFKLTTNEPGDGVPAGEYQVSIMPPPSYDRTPQKVIPDKYQTQATSDLKQTIVAGENNVEIKIERP